MARSTSRLSESERERRRARDRERLQQAAEELLTSEGWERWVLVRSRNGLSRYSVNNQLLIALGRPDATFVAGFRAWLELGYQVRKGEKAIWILAPPKIKERDRVSGEETGETRTLAEVIVDTRQFRCRFERSPGPRWGDDPVCRRVGRERRARGSHRVRGNDRQMARQIEQAIDADHSPASTELAPLPTM
jgi:N-terminal domain of anti-restriction factor ArdC